MEFAHAYSSSFFTVLFFVLAERAANNNHSSCFLQVGLEDDICENAKGAGRVQFPKNDWLLSKSLALYSNRLFCKSTVYDTVYIETRAFQ